MSSSRGPVSAFNVLRRIAYGVRGIVPAAFTPLNEDGTINCAVVPAYAKYLANEGVKAVLVGGTTGEHVCLKVNDRKKVIDAWVAAGRSTNLHIQAHIGGAPFADVIDLAKHCAATGVNSIITLPELYFKPQTVDELVSYVEMVANAAPTLPILYYHNPLRSNVTLNMPAFVARASERIPSFKGIKFASLDLVEAAQVLKIIRDDQVIYMAYERLLAPSALLGINSFQFTTGGIFYKKLNEILDAVEKGDIVRAKELQNILTTTLDSITTEGTSVTTMKAAMEIMSGLKLGPPSLPNKPLSAESRKNIETILRNLGYI